MYCLINICLQTHVVVVVVVVVACFLGGGIFAEVCLK